MNVEIAQRLAELRREKGYSQEELAERLGLSRQAVSKWERAESSPDTGNLVALAKLYGVTLDELLRFEEDLEDDIRYEAQDRTVSAEAKAQAAAEKASVAAAQAAAAAAQAQAAQSAAAVQAQQTASAASSADHARPVDPTTSHAAAQAAQPHPGSQAPGFPPPTGAPLPYYTMPAQPSVPGAAGQPPAPGVPGQQYASGAAPQPNPGQYPVGSREWEDAYVEREMRNATAEVNGSGKGSWTSFPYPILCVIVFLLAGFFWGIWHPAWIVFLTIPIYYYIAHVIDTDPHNGK